jgi:GTP-binding protein EngB required for normal cell division
MERAVEKKKDVASGLNDVAKEFLGFISTEFMDCNSYFETKVQTSVIDLLNVDKPKVMVYGIYNSGKSTLINSLCREEVAEIADRPMTDRIAEYDRGDYYLIDSPGVDAPIEHERVTDEYLDKCHIILFVISSKGLFEDKANYVKLASLIEKEIPFVIVLNDRGYHVQKEWSKEEKEKAKIRHEIELNTIQNKIIKNLVSVSGNQNIADKYEVVILNAKKAWNGVLKNKPQLYESSNVGFLDKRITQLFGSSESIRGSFQQPISNLKGCLNEVEKMVTKTMRGNNSEDFDMCLQTLGSMKENIMDDLRIMTKQAVQGQLDDLTNSYVGGSDMLETIANDVFDEVDRKYTAKLEGLYNYAKKRFGDLNLILDTASNLIFDPTGMTGSSLTGEYGDKDDGVSSYSGESKRWFDWLPKTRKKREKEKEARLRREAAFKNSQAEYRVQEHIRKKQEARQLASSDLDDLYRSLNQMVVNGIEDKYSDLITQIQQVDSLNKQVRENCKRQMEEIRRLRGRISSIENSIS